MVLAFLRKETKDISSSEKRSQQLELYTWKKIPCVIFIFLHELLQCFHPGPPQLVEVSI